MVFYAVLVTGCLFATEIGLELHFLLKTGPTSWLFN